MSTTDTTSDPLDTSYRLTPRGLAAFALMEALERWHADGGKDGETLRVVAAIQKLIAALLDEREQA